MNVSKVTIYPLQNPKVVQANGVVTLNDLLDLKFAIMKGQKGCFVSWKGTERYTKKDGSTGYASPIYIKDEAKDKEVKAAIINKFNGLGGAPSAAQEPTAPVADSTFTSDDIPF